MGLGPRIKQLRKRLKLTQTAFGKLFDPPITREAVSQWESGKTEPHSRNLQRLSRMAGENLMTNERDAVAPAPMPQYRVEVRGAVQGGAFVEAVEWPEEERYSVNVPLSGRYAILSPYALEVRGPSMNQTFPPGTILICVSIHDLPKPFEFEMDKYYIVHRIQPDGLREATVKRVKRAADGSYWLWPESDDPAFQAPIPVGGKPGEEVAVTARVVQMIRNYD